MEDPGTWGKAEITVRRAITDWREWQAQDRGVTGLSVTRTITDALRREGLLKEENGDASST
jgi:hypothetical protein